MPIAYHFTLLSPIFNPIITLQKFLNISEYTDNPLRFAINFGEFAEILFLLMGSMKQRCMSSEF